MVLVSPLLWFIGQGDNFAETGGSLERRLAHAALGAFKPFADFDWTHPRKIDHDAVEALFDLDFLREHINVVFIGSGGVGKTMLAQNLAHRAILAGHTARFVSAADMLGDCAAQDGSANLRDACATTPRRPCSSSMRSDTCPMGKVTPTCCFR